MTSRPSAEVDPILQHSPIKALSTPALKVGLTAIQLLCALALAAPSLAAAGSSDAMQKLADADQADRVHHGATPIDWDQVGPRDARRRQQVLELVRSGALQTDTDYANAALVFQHGEAVDEIQTAYAFATLALRLNPDNPKAKFLSAASWDRMLLRFNKPQWYGTQYVRSPESGKWMFYPTDETAVTDQQRRAFGLDSLAEEKAYVDELNRRDNAPAPLAPKR